VKIQNEEAVAALLRMGADPNTPNKKGATPISAAAHKGSIPIMRSLIAAGAHVNALNTSGSTALIQASHFGHVDAVNLLLQHNASADFANLKGTTALMRASQEGHVAISKLLINAHADVNRKNNEGMNALMLASQRGHADMVMLLIKAGAVMDEQTAQGSTALMLACKRGHESSVEALVSMGAEIYMRDCRARTARDTAMRRNHLNLLCWLDTQMQVKNVQEYKRKMRATMLQDMRKAFEKGRLRLDPMEHRSQHILLSLKRKVSGVEYIQSMLDSDTLAMPPGAASSSYRNPTQCLSCDIENSDQTNLEKIEMCSTGSEYAPHDSLGVGYNNQPSQSSRIEQPIDVRRKQGGEGPLFAPSPKGSVSGLATSGAGVMGAQCGSWCDCPMNRASYSEETPPDLVPLDDNLRRLLKARPNGLPDWEWPLLMLRCFSLPAGVFELICDMIPSPRVWQWSLWRLKQRCKLCPQQAATDLSIIMNEILTDANIWESKCTSEPLVTLAQSPLLHPYLAKGWGMPPLLVKSVSTWADVQSLLSRTTESEVVLKTPLVRKMLASTVALFKWQKVRSSSQKILCASSGAEPMHLGDGGDNLVSKLANVSSLLDDDDHPNNLDATDAGGEGVSDGEGGNLMDPDTETEMQVDGENDDAQVDDSDSDDNNENMIGVGIGVEYDSFHDF
jgi:ankyrin repeat protein